MMIIFSIVQLLSIFFFSRPDFNSLKESAFYPESKESNQRINDLSIYFINLDASIERRKAMESVLPTAKRVAAVSSDEVQKMLDQGQLLMNNETTLVQDEKERNTGRNMYHINEAACALSHLKAILRAYDEGQEYALILEDDTVVKPSLLQNWKLYTSTAPSDWNILQLFTSEKTMLRHAAYLVDPWLAWLPKHFAASAYIVNREGMEQIITKSRSYTSTKSIWNFNERGIVVADELIYYLVERSYVSTYSFVDRLEFKSTIRNETKEAISQEEELNNVIDKISEKGLPPSSWKRRNETVLVLMMLKLDSIESIEFERSRISADVDALASIHDYVRWKINVELIDETLLGPGEKIFASISPNVHVSCTVNYPEVSNSFDLPPSYFSKYDLVLIKDGNQRITGFPWVTFLEQKLDYDSIIAGPLRQTQEGLLNRSRGKDVSRLHFKFHELSAWFSEFTKFALMFSNMVTSDVPFLENYFVVS